MILFCSIIIIVIFFDRCVDICATKTTEGYTPLHLAARYNSYDSYESAEEVDSDCDGRQRGYHSQTSSKQTMEFLIDKNVDVCSYNDFAIIILPYPRERGPMGGAPYIGPR